MDSENREATPLLHMYVPPRSVYARGVELTRLSEDVLVVKESLWSRVVSLALAATIGVLCSLFLYWFLQPLFINKSRFQFDQWLVVGIASLGVLFCLALTLRTLFIRPIRLDQRQGTLSYDGWLFGGWEHCLADLLAIQYCRGKNDVIQREKGRDKITLQYQVNLVFRDSRLTRRNVSQQKHPDRVERIARELAEFLDVPLVNYVGPTGTMDAGDAEIRRLLDAG